MNTRKLGSSDLMITPIGFGAWAVGGPWQFGWGEQSDRDSIAAIHQALELGPSSARAMRSRSVALSAATFRLTRQEITELEAGE